MPKIVHYRQNCIGCDSCVEHAEHYWRIDEDGKSTLERATYDDAQAIGVLDIDEVEVDCNLCAARDCPVRIIRVLDDNGNEMR